MTTCPHCGNETDATVSEQPMLFQPLQLSGYDSNEAATALTLGQKLWRWKTLKASVVTIGMHGGSTWGTFKLWPAISGESVGATSNIGSFSGAQSINDLLPLLFLVVLAIVIVMVPVQIGLWWWKREPYRNPWDVPLAQADVIFDRGPVLDLDQAVRI